MILVFLTSVFLIAPSVLAMNVINMVDGVNLMINSYLELQNIN